MVAALGGPPAAAQFGGPTQVEVGVVARERVAPTIELTGIIHPQKRSNVASEVSGIIEKLDVDVGDFVKKGQFICKTRDTQRRLLHAQFQARAEELGATVLVAESELRKAEFEKQRVENLRKVDGSTEKEIVDALANHAAALARLNQARHGAAAACAAAEQLADQLSRTTVEAPFDGFVIAKHTEVGAWIGEGGAVVDMVDISTVRVRINVPEAVVAFCRPGEEATVSVDALNGRFGGIIGRVIPMAHEQAHTFPVDIDVSNPEHHLLPGMFVRGCVPSGLAADRLVVPKDAVVTQGPGKIVYVVRSSDRGDSTAIVPVQIEAEVFDRVAVSSIGLAPGDRVVVRGNEYMFGPGPVRVIGQMQAAGGNAPPAAPAPVERDSKARPSDRATAGGSQAVEDSRQD